MHGLGALILALVGCDRSGQLNLAGDKEPPGPEGPDPIEGIPGGDTGGADPGGPDPVSDPLFDHTRVHEVRIELPTDSRSALTGAPQEYVSAHITLDGERFEDVGLRLKGNNSFRSLDEKPSFKVKLDEFAPNALGRLRGVTLNNMIEDPTLAREILTYWLWNDADMPASRAAYTRVYVDDAYYGLYLLLESVDEAFVKRRFDDATGDLWEGEEEADLTPLGVQFFDRKAGEGDRARLEAVASALATPSDDYYASAGQHFNMDEVIDYWAWAMATANLDGYPYTLNDYVLYADPSDGNRFVMAPWGMDESWNPMFTFQWGRGVILFGCAADDACLDRVVARTDAALQHYEAADVQGQLQAFYELSATAIAEDTRHGWTPLEIQTARTDLLAFTERWPDALRSQMHGAP